VNPANVSWRGSRRTIRPVRRARRPRPWYGATAISRGTHAMDRHMARARSRGSLRVAGLVVSGKLGSGRQRCVCALPTGPLGRGDRSPLLKPRAEKVSCLGGRSWSRTRCAGFADRCVILGVASNFVPSGHWGGAAREFRSIVIISSSDHDRVGRGGILVGRS
jgi:hypothetical protein